MNYKKIHLPPLTEKLKRKLIKAANNTNTIGSFYDCQDTDPTKANYIKKDTNDYKDFENSGHVVLTPLPEPLKQQIRNHYRLIFPLRDADFVLQTVEGGRFVGPHLDPSDARGVGLIHLIKSGGTNVKTRWYHLKEDSANKPLNNGEFIPYSVINLVEEHQLKEDEWCMFNFKEIHSVENLETKRVGLWAYRCNYDVIIERYG